jgi:hypothetical protein
MVRRWMGLVEEHFIVGDATGLLLVVHDLNEGWSSGFGLFFGRAGDEKKKPRRRRAIRRDGETRRERQERGRSGL